MVDSQVSILENPGLEETDVIPVDAMRDPEYLTMEIVRVLKLETYA